MFVMLSFLAFGHDAIATVNNDVLASNPQSLMWPSGSQHNLIS